MSWYVRPVGPTRVAAPAGKHSQQKVDQSEEASEASITDQSEDVKSSWNGLYISVRDPNMVRVKLFSNFISLLTTSRYDSRMLSVITSAFNHFYSDWHTLHHSTCGPTADRDQPTCIDWFLPTEVVHNILLFLDASGLAAVQATESRLRQAVSTAVYSNDLWSIRCAQDFKLKVTNLAIAEPSADHYREYLQLWLQRCEDELAHTTHPQLTHPSHTPTHSPFIR